MESYGVVLVKKESEYMSFQADQLKLKRLYTLSEEALRDQPLCVIISPVTSEEAALVKTMTAVTFFVYLGVQKLNEPSEHIRHFSSLENLQSLMVDYEAAWLVSLKTAYLEEALAFSEKDEAFIREQYDCLNQAPLKQTPLKQTKKKKSHWIKKRYDKRSSPCIVGLIGHPQTASALVKAYQKMSYDHCLIIDGDLLKPTLDDSFNVRQIETSLKTQLTGRDNTAFNVLVDAQQKGLAVERMVPLIVHRYSEHLDVLFGNYNPHNYEHYKIESVMGMVSDLKRLYDVIFICLPMNLYDELTLSVLHECEMSVLMATSNRADVRVILNTLELIENRRGLPTGKFYFYFLKSNQKQLWHSANADVLRALFKKQYLSSKSAVLRQLLKGRR
ncbi:hypothetical protein KHM83_07650 [Fusibacter paucivorans]|uniref:AAA domain-containing protein n=1 Tax=Fusibacter paucivorans TaxID=76009 RepID=A0ABS5PPN4_9FIRM|nr:hypothetical protein [Fusibacter paucivorans]MBS7526546.1 hypothetical protein [Fusibacter paucivorans]